MPADQVLSTPFNYPSSRLQVRRGGSYQPRRLAPEHGHLGSEKAATEGVERKRSEPVLNPSACRDSLQETEPRPIFALAGRRRQHLPPPHDPGAFNSAGLTIKWCNSAVPSANVWERLSKKGPRGPIESAKVGRL
jgi:hypothetical protein